MPPTLPAITDKYHVSINGKGYIIVDQSYIRRSQLPFVPRFSTGSYGYGDLSFWQFLIQEAWDGGQGQDDLAALNAIRESNGWDFTGFQKPKRPRLCGGSSVPSGITAPTQVNQNWYDFCNLVKFGRHGDGNQAGGAADLNKIVLAGNTGTVDATTANLRTATSALYGIRQFQAYCAFTWQRRRPATEGGLFLNVGARIGANYRILNYDTSFTQVGTNNITPKPEVIVPINANSIFVIGHAPVGTNSETAYYAYWTYSVDLFSGVTSNEGFTGDVPDHFIPQYAFDSNGVLYVAAVTEDISAVTINLASDHVGSAVLLFNPGDITGAITPVTSEIIRYPNIIITGIVSINGTVYLIGSRINRIGVSAIEYQDVVIKFPNTVIWENRKIKTDSVPKNLPKAVAQINRAEAVFVTQSYLGQFDSIMRILPGDIVEEAGAVPPLINTGASGRDNGWMAIQQAGNSYYLYDSINNRFVQYLAQSDQPRTPGGPNCILELSAFGGNTTGIQKSLYKVIVELYKTNLDTTDVMTILINDTQFGQLKSTDFIKTDVNTFRAELTAASEFTGSSFVPKIMLPASSGWRGFIKRVAIQYIPTQLKKRAWGLAIRVEHNNALLNGQKDRREAIEMLADLETAWKSNTPVPFIDTDGKQYNVIITDISSRQPIINQNQKKREYITSIELLEV